MKQAKKKQKRKHLTTYCCLMEVCHVINLYEKRGYKLKHLKKKKYNLY